jgi:hypothetical protein
VTWYVYQDGERIAAVQSRESADAVAKLVRFSVVIMSDAARAHLAACILRIRGHLEAAA